MNEETVTITVPRAALSDFWNYQDGIYDCLGPAADDVTYDLSEEYPLAAMIFDALR